MSNIFDLFRKIETAPQAPISHLVVGLGNPGTEYAHTRHNIGFLTLDRIAERHGAHIDRARFSGLTGEAVFGDVRALLLKPETFMNLSGQAVRAAMAFYKIPPENLIVLCDDVSFDVGRARIRLRGSHGGHNGLRSIVSEIGSEDFARIRIGVGKKPRPDYDLADWVLGKFPPADERRLAELADGLDEAVTLLLAGRADEAMNKYSK